MRILALDLGERRVGVAISDPDGIMAHPLVQLEPRGRRDLVASVVALAEEHEAGRVVAGIPLLPDGTRGEQARRAEGVIAALREVLKVPVVEWDERFSTEDAQEKLRDAGVKPRQRRGRLDKAAAAVILQAYLDAGAPL
jgi:putative Holliday junction resolvase